MIHINVHQLDSADLQLRMDQERYSSESTVRRHQVRQLSRSRILGGNRDNEKGGLEGEGCEKGAAVKPLAGVVVPLSSSSSASSPVQYKETPPLKLGGGTNHFLCRLHLHPR